jgi:hypothetical protein
MCCTEVAAIRHRNTTRVVARWADWAALSKGVRRTRAQVNAD